MTAAFLFFSMNQKNNTSLVTLPHKRSQVVPLSTQINTLRRILIEAQGLAAQIHIVAHSLGAYVALAAAADLATSLILWEPSLSPRDVLSQDVAGLNRKTIDEALAAPSIMSLARRCTLPTSIITADYGGKAHGAAMYGQLKQPIKLLNLPNTGHNFEAPSSRAILFRVTQSLFRRLNAPHSKAA